MKKIAGGLKLRRLLMLLVAGAVAPTLLTVWLLFYQSYIHRYETEVAANLDAARTVSAGFAKFVRGIADAETAIHGVLAIMDGEGEADKFLSKTSNELPGVQSLHYLKRNGDLQYSSDAQRDPQFFRFVPAEAPAGADFFVTDLQPDLAPDRTPAFAVVRAFPAMDALPEGFLVAVVAPRDLFAEILSLPRETETDAVLIDSNGRLVAQSRSDLPAWDERDLSAAPLVAPALAGQEVQGHFQSSSDTDTLVARVPIPPLGWVAGTSRDEAAFLEPARIDYLLSVVVSSGIFILSVAAAFHLSSRVTRNVRQLRQHAKKLEEGLPDETDACPDIAEFTEIKAAFDQMAAKKFASEEQLKRAAQELERSNHDLERFAYVASHDLQEPLRMVAGFVDLLEKRHAPLFDDTAKEYFAFITEGTHRMQAMIADLLAYSRVGRENKPGGPVDLNMVLQNVLRTLQSRAQDTGATVECGPLPTVMGNAALLAQLLQNLVGNAMKFNGGNQPHIKVAATRQDAQWLLTVEDNGIGFPPQAAGRIFEVFQRLHSRDKYEGSGIGLAICKRIVEIHGGRIWAESRPEKGATFFFTLPAAEIHQP